MKRACLPTLMVAMALLTACASMPKVPPAEIVGYVAGWKAPRDFDARDLTVLNYAFLDICWGGQHGNPSEAGLKPCTDTDGMPAPLPDGSLVIDNPARDPGYLAWLPTLKAANPTLRLMAAVGGWTRSNRFSDVATDARARAAFAASAVAFLRKARFDGIDIDWEYPGAIGVPCAPGHTCERKTDKANFVTLVRELRAALDAAGAADGKRYAITIAAANDRAFIFDAGSSAWLTELARELDWINVMTYDYHGSWEKTSGHVAPLHTDPRDASAASAAATIELFLAQGISPARLTLGEPFYGKGWAGCPAGPEGNGLYQPCAGPAGDAGDGSFTFAELVERGYLAQDASGRYTVAGNGFTRHWNGVARVPFLYNPAARIFISYDDEASIHEKNRFALGQGLRGVMFWELAADRLGVLRRAVARDLQR